MGVSATTGDFNSDGLADVAIGPSSLPPGRGSRQWATSTWFSRTPRASRFAITTS
ncbi:MAG: FG-GAP repeat protein [Kiritimatiellae bacterium]|nr:FG-GAP repeat protein [Kiritimatiellia bacterium]